MITGSSQAHAAILIISAKNTKNTEKIFHFVFALKKLKNFYLNYFDQKIIHKFVRQIYFLSYYASLGLHPRSGQIGGSGISSIPPLGRHENWCAS